MSGCCDVGTYEHQVLAFACECCGHNVWVDRCLVDEVRSLHAKGVATIGCCCGHGVDDGYIQVMPEHVDKMKTLGYVQQKPHGDMGLWCFAPKSQQPNREVDA